MGSTFRILLQALAVGCLAAAPLRTQGTGHEEKLGSAIPAQLILKDEAGQPVNLRDLIRKPTILTLNYFRCAGICTPQLNGLVEVLKQPALEPGGTFQVITVSFDPRDTPELATAKRANYLRALDRPLPPEAWRFLTGEPAATQALADAVGFRFERQGEAFTHTAVLIFLSPAGRVARYLYGVSFEPGEVQDAISTAARHQTRTTRQKWLCVCCAPTADGRGQVFSPARTAAFLALPVAVIIGTGLLLRRMK
jgi:protein SCO1/2